MDETRKCCIFGKSAPATRDDYHHDKSPCISHAGELLHSAYQKSYVIHLGIEFPGLDRLHEFPDLMAYVQAEYGHNTAAQVAKRLTDYSRHIGPARRLAPLVQALARHPLPRRSRILDFGCGAGHGVAFLKHTMPQAAICGVDIDEDCLRQARRAYSAAGIKFTKLIRGNNFDLVTAVSTFHHLDPESQSLTLAELSDAVAPGGLLYLHEDSWSGEYWTPTGDRESSSLDAEFMTMPEDEKRRLFVLHEDIASAWVHRRMLNVDVNSYRSYDEWMRMIEGSGMTPIESGLTGFDASRLHGVPACWILARRPASLSSE